MTSTKWQARLRYDPLTPLLSSANRAVVFFASRDLLGQTHLNSRELWELPEAQRIVKRQKPNGSWRYPGGNRSIRSPENYDQIETFRNLGYLVEMFGFDQSSPAIANATDFLLRFQTDEGDVRGILGNQYTPYYTAAIAELLIKAGCTEDERIERIFQWLRSVRQSDGGWAIPLRTRGKQLDVISMNAPTLQPDRSRPSSHLVTGVVLRAYAAHKTYRDAEEAQSASQLLLHSLFKKDRYPDRGAAEYWLRFSYPFWFTDLISATDSLSRIGVPGNEPHMNRAVEWFASNQMDNGGWHLKILKNEKRFDAESWLDLSICRVLQRLFS